jgi:hypothetical protein
MKLVQDFPLIHLLAARAKMGRDPSCDFRLAKDLTARIQIPTQYRIYFEVCERYFKERYDVDNFEKLYRALDPSQQSTMLEEALILDLAQEFEDGYIFICPENEA